MGWKVLGGLAVGGEGDLGAGSLGDPGTLPPQAVL